MEISKLVFWQGQYHKWSRASDFHELCRLCGKHRMYFRHSSVYENHRVNVGPRHIAPPPEIIPPPPPKFKPKPEPEAVAVPKVKTNPTALLPLNTRFFKKEDGHYYFLIELRPTVQPINITGWGVHGSPERNDPHDDYVGVFKVALPWQYFWVIIKEYVNPYDKKSTCSGKIYNFWSLERLKNFDSKVFPAMLPNTAQHQGDTYTSTYGLGYSCLPSMSLKGTVADAVNDLIGRFYNDGFNQPLGIESLVPYDHPRIWQAKTEENPLDWMNWDTSKQVEKPLSKFIDNVRDY